MRINGLNLKNIFCWFISSVAVCFIFISSQVIASSKVFEYKEFHVFRDRGVDVVCDLYEAKENVDISDIMSKKKMFFDLEYREAVSILKRINLLSHDLTVLPVGIYYIPLKKIHKNSFPRQDSGKIKIPFRKIDSVKDLILKDATMHTLKGRDAILKIIESRFGGMGSDSFNEGLKLVELINPGLNMFQYYNMGDKKLDTLFTEQDVAIPVVDLRNYEWYEKIYDEYGELKSIVDPVYFPIFPPSYYRREKEDSYSVIAQLGEALRAKVYDKGTYFLVLNSGEQVEIDSSIYPIIDIDEKLKFIISGDENIMGHPFSYYSEQCDGLYCIKAQNDDNLLNTVLDAIFSIGTYDTFKNDIVISDESVSITIRAKWIGSRKNPSDPTDQFICVTPVSSFNQRTPATILRYLKERNVFMNDILLDTESLFQKEADRPIIHPLFRLGSILSVDDQMSLVASFSEWMGIKYVVRENIDFDFDGIRGQMIAHLIQTEEKKVLIDYDVLYEDAIHSLRESGYDVLQIKPDDSSYVIILKILDKLDIPYHQNPTYIAAQRPSVFNTMIKLKGLEIKNNKQQSVLITPSKLHPELLKFFSDIDFQLIFMEG